MGQTRCINCMELMEDGMASCPHCGYYQEGELSPFGIKPNTILNGHYLVGRILGQGGFGITYVGYDLKLAIKVAIKEYFPLGCATRNYTVSNQIQWNTTQFSREQFQRGSENFLKEARRMAQLDSLPGIVRVRDTFPENQTSYIVMEYIEGETLKQRLQKTGTMQMQDCIELLTPLMKSLEKMHQKGLIHRDISPDNIMIRPDGSACLIDFGAAKDVSYPQSIASQQVVKKGFSPPEQYGEKGKSGPWTDVYALCATIYYCVTGKLVPDAMDRMYEDTLDFSAPIKECMGETAADVLRDGLKFRGEERIQTVEELLGRLKKEPDIPDPKPDPEPKPKKKIVIAAALCAALLCIIVAVFLGGGETQKTLKPEPETGDSPETKENTALFANTLMEDSPEDAVNDVFYGTVLGSNIDRNDIISVTFLDTLNEMPDTAWDASWNQDGTVMAWTKQNAEHESGYDLFIGAEGGVKANDCYRLFAGYYNVETISFQDCFDTTKVRNMCAMFDDCNSLTALDVSGFNTSQVTDMGWMFYGCKGLTELDVSGFDTSQVTNMRAMFCECNSLTALDVSGFDTSQVTNMRAMFDECNSLTALDVSGFDTSQVTNMGWMFYSCKGLAELDVSGFDTSQVTNMVSLFEECNSLTALDVSGFDTSQVTDMGWMFYGCKGLTELDVSNFDTSAVTRMKNMFNKCSSVKSLDVSSFNTDQVTDASYMFYQCTGLTGIDVSNFNINEGTDTTGMFDDCSFTAKDAKLRLNKNVLMLESEAKQSDDGIWQGTVLGSEIGRDAIATVTFTDTLDRISDTAWDVSWDQDGTVMAWTQKNADNEERYDLFIGAEGGVKGKDGSWLFTGYYNAEKIDFNNCFDTSAITNMGCMFLNCESLTGLDVSGFNTSQVTSMNGMFSRCEGLTGLDVSGFDTSSVTNMSSMFYGCKGLMELDLSNFNTSAVITMQGMFYGCESLTELDLSNFNTSAATNMKSMFFGCESLTGLDVSGFNTSAVTDMYGMFCGCKSLTGLDVSGFDTSKVTNMEYMFYNCGITAEQASFQKN